MVFSSFTFLLLFMPVVLLLYRYVPQRLRLPFLLLSSVLFYGWGDPVWLVLLIPCMLINWSGALWMTAKNKKRRFVLILLIVADLLPLLYLKYASFLLSLFSSATGITVSFTAPGLPAGISFFTFQAISYIVDVYRGKVQAQKRFTVFAVYLSFFPQLVAGPIVLYSDMEQQLLNAGRPEWHDMRAGLERFITGLAKKVILADCLGRLWGSVNADLSSAGALGAWLGLLAFSFQICFDFSGYSDMALGLGNAMGFTLPENFNNPYRALSLTDFWRRWHITLTVWFREYVYIPLGGNRKGKIRRDLNVLLVWALTGLWHGAGINFIVWGLYFALLMTFEKRFLLNKAPEKRLPSALRQAVTFFMVFIGWGIFSGFGKTLFPAMLGTYGIGNDRMLLKCAAYAPLLILCGILCFRGSIDGKRLRKGWYPVLLLLSAASLAAQGYMTFVYFRF